MLVAVSIEEAFDVLPKLWAHLGAYVVQPIQNDELGLGYELFVDFACDCSIRYRLSAVPQFSHSLY